jgi:hypothetical protein
MRSVEALTSHDGIAPREEDLGIRIASEGTADRMHEIRRVVVAILRREHRLLHAAHVAGEGGHQQIHCGVGTPRRHLGGGLFPLGNCAVANPDQNCSRSAHRRDQPPAAASSEQRQKPRHRDSSRSRK